MEQGPAGCTYWPRRRGFGALRTADFRVWEDVSEDLRAPPTHAHGTALRLTRDALCSICGARGGAAGWGGEGVSFLLESCEGVCVAV